MSAPLAAPFLRLIAGLGNPGREYADTRHNVGFMIADRLVAKAGATFRVEKNWQAAVARAGDLVVCKPLTYMNLSGEAVQSVCSFYKIPPAQTFVILDDLSLPLGKLRIRAEGSAGGHNGLKSIIQRLGTQAVPRLRIGIGSASPGAAVEHVLGRFAPDEQGPLNEALQRAEAAIGCACDRGLDAAMNAFN